MGYKIAVVGATGLVGHEIIEILGEGNFDVDALHALTHKSHAGRELSYGNQDIKTQDVATFDFQNADVVFYAGGLADAKNTMDKAVKSGCRVIDCMGYSTFEANDNEIISLPSAASSLVIDAVQSIHDMATVKRLTLTTFEAASGEGKEGMDELFNQSRKFFVSDGMEPNVFAKQIAFNVIPQIDDFMDDGITESEWRMAAEIKKFLDKNVKVSATRVQVPVFMGHGIAVNVETEKDIDARDTRASWREQDHIIVIDRESDMGCVSPAEIAGEDAVFISRIRNDSTLENGLSFWVAGDNVRHAALKAIAVIFAP